MTLCHGSVAFPKHSGDGAADDITAAEDDDVLACDRDVRAVDEGDAS